MKCLLLLSLALLGGVKSYEQESAAIRHATGHRSLTPDSLAHVITQSSSTNRQKVDAICDWIITNIAYNTRPGFIVQQMSAVEDAEDTDAPLLPLDERIAQSVIDKRIAFCDGYARLFKTLCHYAGIRAEIVTGYANGGYSPRRNFISNHRWNAVFIDSAWHLMDLTWASGYLSYANQFVAQPTNTYLFAEPASFASNHHPEDPRWNLLPEPAALSEFYYSPFKTFAYVRFHISAHLPQTGVINAHVGDTLQFSFQAKPARTPPFVTDHPLFAPESIDADTTLTNTDSVSPQLQRCTYTVLSPSVRWLHVVYNNEIILRYRLVVSGEVDDKHHGKILD